MPTRSQKKKGSIQKATRGSFRGSTTFPFIKRDSSKKSVKPSVKSVVSVADIKNQLSKPVKKKSMSRLSSLFRRKPQNQKLSTSVRIIKYTIFALLFISFLISLVYFILYMRDYFQNENSLEEKELLKMSIIGSAFTLGINIILLAIVNSYWQMFDSFSIPLSIALR